MNFFYKAFARLNDFFYPKEVFYHPLTTDSPLLIAKIPDSVMLIIFNYFSFKEQTTLALVSKKWYLLSLDKNLGLEYCQQFFKVILPNLNTDTNSYYGSYYINDIKIEKKSYAGTFQKDGKLIINLTPQEQKKSEEDLKNLDFLMTEVWDSLDEYQGSYAPLPKHFATSIKIDYISQLLNPGKQNIIKKIVHFINGISEKREVAFRAKFI